MYYYFVVILELTMHILHLLHFTLTKYFYYFSNKVRNSQAFNSAYILLPFSLLFSYILLLTYVINSVRHYCYFKESILCYLYPHMYLSIEFYCFIALFLPIVCQGLLFFSLTSVNIFVLQVCSCQIV